MGFGSYQRDMQYRDCLKKCKFVTKGNMLWHQWKTVKVVQRQRIRWTLHPDQIMQLICMSCNFLKANLPEVDFITYLHKLQDGATKEWEDVPLPQEEVDAIERRYYQFVIRDKNGMKKTQDSGTMNKVINSYAKFMLYILINEPTITLEEWVALAKRNGLMCKYSCVIGTWDPSSVSENKLTLFELNRKTNHTDIIHHNHYKENIHPMLRVYIRIYIPFKLICFRRHEINPNIYFFI
ncbi:hypothetical protein BDA99DRAFT_533072 [Phascolomyces articulosus]|uniref:Uncharacterized protein n=1 Tax=Phascolomyces articulosus TaxID=60185 RepID=A0AAD5PIH0_9FUNG|nr:hypothetical protein BDA99DRAFT_533072 [Phascolomyces articulosus]